MWSEIQKMNNGRILVMDDVEDIRDILTKMLNRIHFEVEVAEDGNEAIELFQRAMWSSKPFDVVIMDLVVANGMGGEEAIRRLHEIDPGVRIILSSGSISNHVMINFKEYGISAILRKPFKVNDLKRILELVETE